MRAEWPLWKVTLRERHSRVDFGSYMCTAADYIAAGNKVLKHHQDIKGLRVRAVERMGSVLV